MARHVGVPIPTGIPAWGVDEEELTQACLLPRNTAAADPPTAVEGVSMKAKLKRPLHGIVRDTLIGRVHGNEVLRAGVRV